MAVGVPNAGTATTFATGNTSIAVPYPATTHAGAVLTLSFSLFGLGATATTPTGWTLQAHVGSGGGTAVGNVNMYTKNLPANGTEGGTSLTVAHASSAGEAQIVEWAGVDINNPLDVAAVLLDQTTASTTNVSLPLPTTVTDGTTLYYGLTSNTATQTATQPGGYTELSDGSGASCLMESAYLQDVAAGAHANVTVVMSGGGKQVAWAVALRPAITPAPTRQVLAAVSRASNW